MGMIDLLQIHMLDKWEEKHSNQHCIQIEDSAL